MLPLAPIHILSGICKYVTLNSKRDFVIKVIDLEIRKLPWIIQVGAVLSQGLLYKKEPQVSIRERDVAVEAEVGVMWGQELRNEGAYRC